MKKPSTKRRQTVEQKVLLEQLRKIPIIQVACERASLGRSSFYRWCHEDAKFKKDAEEAMREGEEMVNDLSESQLINMVKDKNFHAIQLWLRQHHPKYGNKLEVRATLEKEDPMTPEQEALVREALGIKEKHA
jgi:hypothetical protein